MKERILAFFDSRDLLLRVGILNIILLVGLIIYGTINQYQELINENALSVFSFFALRILGGIVFIALSTLPYFIGWQINTKLSKKYIIRIVGIIIFLIMVYQYMNPLFTKTRLPFAIAYIVIPIVLNGIIILMGMIMLKIEKVNK